MSQDCSPDTDAAATIPPAPTEQGTVHGAAQVAGQDAERRVADAADGTADHANGAAKAGVVGPTTVAAFLGALFAPDDVVLIRPVEVWEEDGKKRNEVKHKQIKYFTAKRLASDAPTWKAILQKAEKQKANLFFGVCPRFGRKEYDRAFQIRIVRALWADLDNCTVKEALERCNKAGLPPPSFTLCSGHGCHLYWLLTDPYVIDDVGDPLPIKEEWVKGPDGESVKSASGKACPPRKYVELAGEKVYEFFADPKTGADNRNKKNPEFPNALCAKALHVQHVLGGIAALIGGDHTKDLSRLLRLPGTLNRKDQRNGKEPVPCEMVECEPTRRYSFADFEGFASSSPDRVRSEALAKIRLPKNRLSIKRKNTIGDYANRCAVADDRSVEDYALCCWAIREGLAADAVWAEVQDVGKFGQRGRDYFDQTWGKAEEEVRGEIYDRTAQRVAGKRSTTGQGVRKTNGAASPAGEQQRPESNGTPPPPPPGDDGGEAEDDLADADIRQEPDDPHLLARAWQTEHSRHPDFDRAKYYREEFWQWDGRRWRATPDSEMKVMLARYCRRQLEEAQPRPDRSRVWRGKTPDDFQGDARVGRQRHAGDWRRRPSLTGHAATLLARRERPRATPLPRPGQRHPRR